MCINDRDVARLACARLSEVGIDGKNLARFISRNVSERGVIHATRPVRIRVLYTVDYPRFRSRHFLSSD